ncbi:MAG: TonB-dependent receptor domain-containing protein [Gammaproteobacteria bacterium]
MHTTRQALLYLLLAWVAPHVLAEQTALHVNVPPQSLAAALDSLAQQAHLQIIYNPDTLGEQSSRAVVGTYTPREAIEKLLAGTGLSYTFTAEDTVSVRTDEQSPPKSANEPASKPDGPTVLPEMTVTAKPTDATSYNVPNATTATKTDTPIMETPASINVITRKQLDEKITAVRGGLTWRASLIGSYAYTDGKVTKDNSALEGKRLFNVPEHAGSLWLKYDMTSKTTRW